MAEHTLSEPLETQTTDNPRRRRRGRNVPPAVQHEIESLALEHPDWSAPTIYEHLNDLKRVGVPAVYTIQRMLRAGRPKDSSELWTLGPDAPLLLPVLAAIVERTLQPARLTRGQAAWVVRVRQAAPDLPLWWAFWLSEKYRIRNQQGQATDSLDLLLAFAPWRSTEDFVRFMLVSEKLGWIPHPSILSGGAVLDAVRVAYRAVDGAVVDAFRMESERTGLPTDVVHVKWLTLSQETLFGLDERLPYDVVHVKWLTRRFEESEKEG